MPVNFSPRVVRELNVDLVACFAEGVNDAINAVLDELGMLDGGGAQPIGTVMELARTVTSDTADNAFTYPQKDFDIVDFGSGDETPEEGIKLYEHRIASGDYKGKVIPVKLSDYMDDKVGQYRVIFYRFGKMTVLGPLRLVEQTLLNAA